MVIADYADNPGAGGYGDSTELLRALLETGAKNTCFAPMVDLEVAELLHNSEVGDLVQVELGGSLLAEIFVPTKFAYVTSM